MHAGVRTQNEGVCSMCGQMPHAEALSALMVVAVFVDSDFFFSQKLCACMYVFMCVSMGTSVPWYICGAQRTTCGSCVISKQAEKA